MANKVTWTNLKAKAKIDTSVKTFEYEGMEIEVKQYLPIEDKVDLIQTALQKSEQNGIFVDPLLDMYFNLGIVYLYTNISFTDKQREEEAKIYDILQSNDLIAKIISNMGENEYQYLVDYLEAVKLDLYKYRLSAAAMVTSVIQDLPKNAAVAAEIVENFNPKNFEQIQSLLETADKTGMNNIVQMPTKE